MAADDGFGPGHYGALGVPASAAPRQIEQAFRGWGERLAGGRVSLAAYRRAESAYYVLAAPEARARHDRQLGLIPHPAWRAGRDRRAGALVGRALRELGRRRVEPARQLLESAVARDPDDPVARSYLAVALTRSGRGLHEAARHARFAVACRPRDPAFLFNLAEVYGAAGFPARALATRARGWHAVVSSLIGRKPM
jgi:predicted Zn-dependent protease